MRQQAGTADADREEVWGRVLLLVASLRGALSADHLTGSVLRVGEPPHRQIPLVAQAELVR